MAASVEFKKGPKVRSFFRTEVWRNAQLKMAELLGLVEPCIWLIGRTLICTFEFMFHSDFVSGYFTATRDNWSIIFNF